MDYVCKQLNVSEENNKIPHKEVKLIEGLEKNYIGKKIILPFAIVVVTFPVIF